jgi:hypothetical protein
MKPCRTKIRLLMAVLALMPLAACAQLDYTTNNNAITITGYSGSESVLVIPNSINGYPVTSIGDAAFENSSLISVTIPNSVTRIEDQAFMECYGLASLIIPDSVTFIGTNAFTYSGLTNVAIGKSVTSIGDGAFEGCALLTNVTIPNNVTCIEAEAFENCYGLTSITIPNSVTSVGYRAFYVCTRLTSITIGDSVTNIGDGSFSACNDLANVTIGSSVTTIADAAFEDSGLTSIVIPNSVTCIGTNAFAFTSLTNVTIGNSVTNIADEAFEGCFELTSITIPNNVSSIGEGAFYDCTGLTSISVAAGNAYYSSTNGVLFDKSQTTLIQFPEGLGGTYLIPNGVTSIGNEAFELSGLSSVIISDSVTNIGDNGFLECDNLTNVNIGKGVTSIGNQAFYNCPSLTSMTIPNRVTSIGANAFFWCANLTAVYFGGNAPSPDSSVFDNDNATLHVYYLPDSSGWTSNYDGLPTVLWNPQVQTSGPDFALVDNKFGFNIVGATNLVVVVEACTNLSDPIWVPLSTNTLTSGSSYFSDPGWTNYPNRFYGFSFR